MRRLGLVTHLETTHLHSMNWNVAKAHVFFLVPTGKKQKSPLFIVCQSYPETWLDGMRSPTFRIADVV